MATLQNISEFDYSLLVSRWEVAKGGVLAGPIASNEAIEFFLLPILSFISYHL